MEQSSRQHDALQVRFDALQVQHNDLVKEHDRLLRSHAMVKQQLAMRKQLESMDISKAVAYKAAAPAAPPCEARAPEAQAHVTAPCKQINGPWERALLNALRNGDLDTFATAMIASAGRHATTRLLHGGGPDGNLAYGELYNWGGQEPIFTWLLSIGAQEQDDAYAIARRAGQQRMADWLLSERLSADDEEPLATNTPSKFTSSTEGDVPTLILGRPAEAAQGLNAAIGLHDEQLSDFLQAQDEAIVREFLDHGTAEDRANLLYVFRGVAQRDLPPQAQRDIAAGCYHGGALAPGDYDEGHEGMCLDDFVAHSHSTIAGLSRAHVLALRMYTTSSYRRITTPLRARQKPHPFAATLYYLSDGIRKLRAVAAELEPEQFTADISLWRGMRDMRVLDSFMQQGGAEIAPMSTSISKDVAMRYADSAHPLIFHFHTQGMERGCSLKYLSVYPKEQEVLYPPLTFLQPVRQTLDNDGRTIIEARPQIS